MNADIPIVSAAKADCEFELIKAATIAIGEANIIPVIKVPTVKGNKKTPNIAAIINIGNPQNDSSPSHAVMTKPIPAIKPKRVPIFLQFPRVEFRLYFI